MTSSALATATTLRGRTVAVIGLGCIGGSLARDLSSADARVLGFDRDTASLAAAVDAGAVHRALDATLDGIEHADWLVLATPVDESPALLEALAPRLTHLRLITDVGSTKSAIVRTACRLGLERFVGGHPFAGSHRCGWDASRPGLFRDATVYLCPAASSRGEALADARTLWGALGARIVECSAAEHDTHLAWVSHLPHLASFALALTLDTHGEAHDDLGTGGRDAVRLAASAPAVWRAIAMENRELLAAAVDALEGELHALRTALERGDSDTLGRRIERAAAWCSA
ncbi:MAG TPA: prephenate dehydrogenase [Gemmatimonadaceae bacterium]|nr:prephenate dehydrogenase [Gemmatimonadaceae bacterium]